MPVLDTLHRCAARHGTSILVIGAAARDLVVHLPADEAVQRATLDVDVAVATPSGDHFHAITQDLEPTPGHTHRFLVHGVNVDIVPFGPIESTTRDVAISDGHVLDVNGIAEAAASADQVRLSKDLTVAVASLPAQCALKVLAWRDRHRQTTKDAADLRSILSATSTNPPYVDESWADSHALEVNGHDIVRAGAFRAGRAAARLFTADHRVAVARVLSDPRASAMLQRDMASLAAEDLLRAFRDGYLGYED